MNVLHVNCKVLRGRKLIRLLWYYDEGPFMSFVRAIKCKDWVSVNQIVSNKGYTMIKGFSGMLNRNVIFPNIEIV